MKEYRYNFTASDKLNAFLKENKCLNLIQQHHINYLLEKWEEIVEEYDKIQNNLFEEYLTDIDNRHLINEIIVFFDEKQKQQIQVILELADEKFRNNSDESLVCIWGNNNEKRHNYRRDNNWYYYRVIRCLDNENWFEYHPNSLIKERDPTTGSS